MVGTSDRRFLALPAVHPSYGVSPAALLRSLAALARDIRRFYRSSSFPTHRRSVRTAVRLAGVLLELLEVAEAGAGAGLPGSAVLALCELHVAFQKARLLLRDCGRRGARLYLLARSDRVTSEFRALTRSVATALDVLPLASLDVPPEVEEVVRLVAEQTWRADVRTDPADALLLEEVVSILGQLGENVAPDRSRLGRVMNRLQVRSWADCDEEVAFLEEELGAAALSSNGDVGEISLLSSLRGLMLYSRSVVFDAMDDRGIGSSDPKLEGELEGEVVLAHLNPEEFRCPISLELMQDPVTVSTGQTYDRASITKWLKSGNHTCPVTGKRLRNPNPVPNATLRKLILQFCQEHNISTAEAGSNGRQQHFSKTHLPGSPAAAGAIKLLCNFLVTHLSSGSEGERRKAIYEVRLLAKRSVADRGYLVEAGAVPCLLHLLHNPSLQGDAIAAILNLSKHPMGKKAIFESTGLGPVLGVLKTGLKAESQHNAAATIFYLSSVEEYRREIGETPDAIPTLVELLRNGSIRGKKNAAVALLGLLLFSGNHGRVVATGVVSDLINLLSSDREDLVGECLAVLAALAERREGAQAILRSSAVPALVKILQSPSSRVGKEYCVSVLLHLCSNGGTRVVSLLDGVPSLVPALYMVLAEGSQRAAKKASTLISILHSGQGIPAIPAPQVEQEYAVRVQ
uniref:RING-type E3 ubiquitin transferase n=1 Tax=Anthurium amnicola TaxID=1678845 RepID=A0A1D1XMS8_9ARAE